PAGTVAKQLLETRGVLRRRDDEDVADAGEHQRGQWVIHQRLVVDRKQLLGNDLRHGIEARSRAAREDDALHAASERAKCVSMLARYQRTVFSSPDSKLSRGAQPSSRRIFVMSIA